MAAELLALADSGTIRVIDALILSGAALIEERHNSATNRLLDGKGSCAYLTSSYVGVSLEKGI